MPLEYEALSKAELVSLLRRQDESGIRINFSGKQRARRLARLVRPRTMRTIKKYSAGSAEDQARNLLIEGENLQAMSTLYRERGQVDLIFTDPPYNTGRDDFRYNDKWDEDPNDPGLGNLVLEDDGARHTKWMRFMWPRLQMAQSMLKQTGVLAICIDHRELFRLGQMLDELFGEKNRLAILNWQRSYTQTNDAGSVATTTEYVLVYAREASRSKTGLLPRTEKMDVGYGSTDGDERLWDGGPATGSNAKNHMGMVYAIESPFTGELHYPPDGSAWRFEQRQNLEWLRNWGCEFELKDIADADTRSEIIGRPVDAIPDARAIVVAQPLADARDIAYQRYQEGNWPIFYFMKKGKGRPRIKRYFEDVKQGKIPTTFWADDDFYAKPAELGAVSWKHRESGHSQQGADELTAIVGPGHDFKTVKPMKLFTKVLQLWCPPDGLVLDPFAGSGTIGHAVLALNHNTEADRRFIAIEQGRPEKGDSYARYLTADRLQRVVTGHWVSGDMEPLEGGYRFTKLAQKVDGETLLKMERDEMTDAVIASHHDDRAARSNGLVILDDEKFRYLVARNSENEGFFLVWSGPDENTDFTEEVYEACSEEAKAAGLRPTYHVYARLYLYQTGNVRFYQIPDRILSDFGLDLRSDSYTEESE